MKRWMIFGFLLCWLFGGAWAEANSRNYRRGYRDYRKRRCSRAIRYLERSIKDPKRRLKRKYMIRAYKMLASCYYRRRRRSKARKRYRAALRISLSAGLPGRVSRRGRRFFWRIRKAFRKEQKKSGPAMSFQMKPKTDGPTILPDNPNSRAVPPPMALPTVPGVKLPDDGPGGKSIKNANRAVVAPRDTVPDDGGGLFKQSGKASNTPYRATSPSPAQAALRRHRFSMIVGGIGLATLAVGIGIGAAFGSQKASLQQLLNDRSTSVAQLEEAQINAEGLVVPANVLLLTGSLISAAAVGILIAEVVAHNKKQAADSKKKSP